MNQAGLLLEFESWVDLMQNRYSSLMRSGHIYPIVGLFSPLQGFGAGSRISYFDCVVKAAVLERFYLNIHGQNGNKQICEEKGSEKV